MDSLTSLLVLVKHRLPPARWRWRGSYFSRFQPQQCSMSMTLSEHPQLHHGQCFPQVENKALTKLAFGQLARHRRAGGRVWEGGVPPLVGGGVWGVPPKKKFEILHAVWWHLVTSEAISWPQKRKCFLRIVFCEDPMYILYSINVWRS